MTKCFLSHSSYDKKRYVENVARKLKKDKYIYDEFTFEAGMSPLEEILSGLEKSSVFVVFLSDTALSSEWVKLEITNAKRISMGGNIQRIFPIIIDENITHEDKRIPDWMREGYVLKYISRPTIAARRIEERLREIGWKFHPKLEARKNIFVGRNEIIEAFEERIDDFDKPTPTCIIASGINEIGRRSLLKECCRKANLVNESYSFSCITLNRQEGLDDFTLKLHDLGFSKDRDLTGSLSKKLKEKVEDLLEISKEIQKSKELIMIVDEGCLIQSDGNISDWFTSVLNSLKINESLTFLVAARYRVKSRFLHRNQHVYSINVPELSKRERSGLLKRYSELEGLNLDRESLSYFSNILNGFPGQVLYAVLFIKSDGIEKARRNAHHISDFSTLKSQKILEIYENDTSKMEVLYLLSEFDFISFKFALEIVKDENFFNDFIDELLTASICELLGSNGEYLRVNDTLRDHIKRNRYKLPEKYRKRLKTHIDEFLGSALT